MNRGARWPIQLVEVEVHTHFSIVYFAIPCLSVDCTSLPVDKKELRVMYKLCAAAVVIKGERLLQITMPALHHTRGHVQYRKWLSSGRACGYFGKDDRRDTDIGSVGRNRP